MAKLSAHGIELYRYFSTKYGGLLSIRSDGYALIRYPGSTWKLKLKRKEGKTLEDWAKLWAEVYERLPSWKKRVEHLPSLEDLRHWTFDSVCETTTGEMLEPDYRGNGAEIGPSWLVALRYI